MGTFTDGLINLVSRLGTSADKAAHNTYVSGLHSPVEIQAAYQTSWYGHIVDIIAEDCFREWRAVQGENEEIEAIEKEEARLKSRLHLHDAYKLALTEGGAAVFMGGLPGDPAMPVNVAQIGLGALKYLAVMRKDEIRAHDRITDPLDPNFGQPSWYEVNQRRIHPSRVIRFVGMPRQNEQGMWDGWGDPLWARLSAVVSNLDATSAGMAAMVQEAKLDIIKIPGFTEIVSTQAGENMIMRRLMVGNQLKSILNALVMDAGDEDGKGGEEYETKQLSFAGLDKVWDRHALALSGMSGIPQTRLYGRSPEGMNSTGEADEANHAKAIKARQELQIEPALAGYNEIIIRSALGRRPEKVYFEWRSLYSISEYRASEIEKRYAEAFKTRLDTGAIADDVLAKSELNRMIESGRYPGIEAAIKEAGDDGMPSEEEAREIEAMNALATETNEPLA